MHGQRNGKRQKREKTGRHSETMQDNPSADLPSHQAELLGSIFYMDLVKPSLLPRQVVLKAKVLPCRSHSWSQDYSLSPGMLISSVWGGKLKKSFTETEI